eukprot:5309947-Amphidinium_carterae.1
MDSRYGRGQWRPIPRHVISQTAKFRPIDDGSRASLNSASHMQETIVCQSGEFLVAVARKLLRRLHAKHGKLPSWATLAAGVEDWSKGYRQNYPSPADACFCVITYVDPDTRRR